MNAQTVFGIHAVTALLGKNPQRVIRLYLCDDRDDQRLRDLQQLAVGAGVALQKISRRDLDRRFADTRHQGAVAECRGIEPVSEPQLLQKLMDLDRPALLLVLDGVTDPHNLGAILRSADATGVDCVVAPKAGSASITPVVRKIASGAAESVPFCQVTNLARTLGELKSLGVWLYGADVGDESVNYTSVDYSGSVGLVLGAEGKGLRRLTRQACDGLISIPMNGMVESLNVSVATGICLYEVVRQRAIADSQALK